jgi:hypothetical protein
MPRNRRTAKERNGEPRSAASACEADAVGTASPRCAHLSEAGRQCEMERRLNAVFIKIFAAHDVLTSVPALQGCDPYGLASEGTLHSCRIRRFALSPDRASR